MAPPIRFLPHTTDIQFEARGRTLAICFQNAALATFSSMTALSKVAPKQTFRFSLRKRTDDISLLYDFLDKLIFLFDSKRVYLSRFKVTITKTGLSAIVKGEKISDKHQSLAMVKSVTYHEMSVERRGKEFVCRAILDI
jgi:SHS2 domain-containing protein